MTVTDFHIQDGLLLHIGHLSVPPSEHAKMICEAHYSWMAGHFGMEKTVVVLQKKIIGQNFDKMSTSISDIELPMPFPSQP
jgi:hypothetical protein